MTYTSKELSSMAALVPDIAASKKMRLFDAMYLNEPEVSMDADSVSIDEAIEIAVLAGAPFVSLDMDEFDSAELLAVVRENIPEDSPSAENLNRLVNSAAKHNGDTEQLWLRWAAQGLSYEWNATADWRRKLAVDLAKADFEGRQQAAVQSQARDAEIDSLMTLLMDSQEFRAAMPTKRIPTGVAVVAASSHGVADESLIRQAASRASTEIDRRVLQLEISLRPEMGKLAEELRKSQAWRAATSITKRHAAAVEFLMSKTEGYRLSPRITDPLMNSAKELDDSTTNKIILTPQQ